MASYLFPSLLLLLPFLIVLLFLLETTPLPLCRPLSLPPCLLPVPPPPLPRPPLPLPPLAPLRFSTVLTPLLLCCPLTSLWSPPRPPCRPPCRSPLVTLTAILRDSLLPVARLRGLDFFVTVAVVVVHLATVPFVVPFADLGFVPVVLVARFLVRGVVPVDPVPLRCPVTLCARFDPDETLRHRFTPSNLAYPASTAGTPTEFPNRNGLSRNVALCGEYSLDIR